jgi:hypothetical protein
MNTITDLINMADVRDSQRSKVYFAEAMWMYAYPGTRLETVTDMEAFTADVWRICRLPGNVPAIRPGHAARSSVLHALETRHRGAAYSPDHSGPAARDRTRHPGSAKAHAVLRRTDARLDAPDHGVGGIA